MSHEPWKADRELSDLGVRGALSEQFPELALQAIEYLGSGWDYDAYLIDHRLVVRFPRREEVARRLDREEAILRFVRSSIGDETRVPEIIVRGQASTHFPYQFFGHAVIPGVEADDPDVPSSAELATDLGVALSRIHSIAPDSAGAIGIGIEEEGCEVRFLETLERIEMAPGVRDLVPEPLEWIESRPSMPREYAGPARFIHNDLCSEHILVDRGSGRLTGIIDWSDAALGDPALDFVGLVFLGGPAFVESALSVYRPSLDEGFRERLLFLARTLSMKWLADAIRRKRGDVESHRVWVLNSFAR